VTSHVEQAVQQRIAAARIKVQAAKERRASFAEARRAGLARRHAAKLRRAAPMDEHGEVQEQEPEGGGVLLPDVEKGG
jgi:hypothetical protein